MFNIASRTRSYSADDNNCTARRPSVVSGLAALVAAVRKGLAINPLLMFAGLLMIIAFVGAAIGMIVDPRVITGAPAWLKPAKFAVSISIYSFSFLYLLSFVQGHHRLKAIVASITALGVFIEMGLIVMQVIRGTTSHFNLSTQFDGTVFSIMAFTIVLVWIMGLITAGMLLRQRISDSAFAMSLRFGIIIALVGMAVAFLMTGPSAQQLAAAHSGAGMPVVGGHSVGIADGGPGLPFLGWSTVGGDLRVPHFFGLHGLQVLPFIGWLLTRRKFSGLSTGHRTAIIATFGLSYLGLLGLLTWQALRAQSLIAPDAITLQVFAALVSVTALALIGIAAHAKLRSPMQKSAELA